MQSSASAQKEKRQRAFMIVFSLWLPLAFPGMVGLWFYSTTPGKNGSPPDRWPASSNLRRAPRTSTVLMFVPGGTIVASYANTGASPLDQAPVFGCPLFNEPDCQAP
jgi:hypothetical protein